MDLLFSYWFCSLNLKDIDGWGFTYLPGLSYELFICDLSKVSLSPYESRYVGRYDEGKIIETYNGDLTGNEIKAIDIQLYNLQ